MIEDKMLTSVKCWNCGEPIVKSHVSKGLIKSQLIFFEGNQLIARCKKCKQNNVLPMTINKSQLPEPKLMISIAKEKNNKPLAKSSIGMYNNNQLRRGASSGIREQIPGKA